MKKFEQCWKFDTLYQAGYVEVLPISWYESYMPKIVEYTITDTHGNPVTIEGLQQHILENGLHHPAVMEVSRINFRARLFSGKNRITIASNLGMTYFPSYVLIRSVEFTNGCACNSNLKDIVTETRGNVIAKPSDVFLDVAKMKQLQLIP